jgi:hypothetical protein
MLTVVEGKLLNSREVGNAVALMLLDGKPIDEISKIAGMPTPTQIAWMRKNDPGFAEAMHTAFEGAGIEAAFTLIQGARTGRIGKTQVDSAQWVAERMAPDLFQERKTITNHEVSLSDDELRFQLQAAARSDERVRRILAETGDILEGEANGNHPVAVRDTGKIRKQLRRFIREKK